MGKELPDNWVNCKLGEVLTLKNGYAFKSQNYREEGVPVIRISDIQEGEVKPEGAVCVEASSEYERFIIDKGDILVAMSGATTGKYGVFKSNEAAYQNQRVGNFKPFSEDHLPKTFVYYLLGGLKKEIEDQAYGGAQPNISSRMIENLDIQLPPLPEQKRIVAKLDGLFAHLEELKERLANVPELLKQFRQAILDESFSFDFERKVLKDVCLKIQDGAHHSPKNQYPENDGTKYLYITSKNIRNNYMKLDNIVYVDKEFHDTIYPRCTPEYGDVLLTKDGANTGNVTLNSLKEEFSLLSSVCLIKTNKEKLLPSYLKYFIQSPKGFKELTGEMTGTAIKRIVLKKIKAATIPLPTLKEQTEIVRRVESLFAKADAIQSQYESLVQKIEDLRPTILAKAFRGELVEQLETDGDARELLEEIKKMKKEQQKKTKKIKSDIQMVKAKTDSGIRLKAEISSSEIEGVEGAFMWMHLRSNIGLDEFTFDQIPLPPRYSYDKIKEEVFELLDMSKDITKGPRLVQIHSDGIMKYQIKLK